MYYEVMNVTKHLNMTSQKLIKHLNAYDIEHAMLSFTLELKKTQQDQIL